ncbi:MAG: hypothetical protein M3162_03605 [Thermoproteota archaeon]|nr:hypothetical protein [Thermoproteota archaeon]
MTILQIRIILNKHGLKRLIKNQESYLAKKSKSAVATTTTTASADIPMATKLVGKKENLQKTHIKEEAGKSQLEL